MNPITVPTTEPLQSAPANAHRADIQGLRAVAVLLVVLYHSGAGLPGGFVGVDLFFVISGYVITRMLMVDLRARNQNEIDLKRFYLKRMRRILPALGLLLTATLTLGVLLAPIGGQQATARTGAAAALFSANVFLIRSGGDGYFDVGAEVNAMLHTWGASDFSVEWWPGVTSSVCRRRAGCGCGSSSSS